MTAAAPGTPPGTPTVHPGPGNTLTDVAGLRVGHATRIGDGWLSGCTVVLGPPAGMAAGVDVRGGGPGTRETDLLAPTASVERITAVTLTGGSAFGLAAADGVAQGLADRGLGLAVGPDPAEVVPLVPAAVIFDLGRGGRFRATPDAATGRAALDAALDGDQGSGTEVPIDGCVGAGTGAMVAGLKGGIGSASAVLADGTVIGALVVVNAMGSPVDLRTGALLGSHLLLPQDDGPAVPASPDEVAALLGAAQPRHPTQLVDAELVRNTTIGVVATDAALTKAQCTKLAAMAHDGLARTLQPVHTQFDGDTLFGLSTAQRPAPDPIVFHDILCAAADVVGRAVLRAVLAATAVSTPAGSWSGYADLVPSARGSRP